jgi:hypothetical protein
VKSGCFANDPLRSPHFPLFSSPTVQKRHCASVRPLHCLQAIPAGINYPRLWFNAATFRREHRRPERGFIADYGTNFLALPLITVGSDVPSGSTTDVKRKRNSFMLSSHTNATVAVSSKFPDWSNSPKVLVPVQSRLTVYVPESVELLTPPFKLAVTEPLIFPAASSVNRAKAALGPIPTTVPLSETPYAAAARASEHAAPSACAVAAPLIRVAAKRTTSVVSEMLRFISLLLNEFSTNVCYRLPLLHPWLDSIRRRMTDTASVHLSYSMWKRNTSLSYLACWGPRTEQKSRPLQGRSRAPSRETLKNEAKKISDQMETECCSALG